MEATTTQTASERQAVAQEILRQMGGMNRLKVFVGAWSFAAETNAVSFMFKGSRKAHYAKITLNPSDTYNVEFGKISRKGGVPSYAKVAEHEFIYCDQLVELFESETGLYLHF